MDYRARAASRKAGEQVEVGVRTALDDEDVWDKEFSSFTPTPRTTEADESGDVRSLRRALDRPLHLIVERKIGTDDHRYWDLPAVIHQASQVTHIRRNKSGFSKFSSLERKNWLYLAF